MATEYEVRAGKDGEFAIFLRNWNVRVATFEDGVTDADKEEIARLLQAGWRDVPNTADERPQSVGEDKTRAPGLNDGR